MNWLQYYFQSTIVVCPYCQTANAVIHEDYLCKGEGCGREIPPLFRNVGHVAPILVPMIGWTNVGKTMSTFAMMLTLDRIAHVWPRLLSTYGSAETMAWMRNSIRELEGTGELPGPTTEAIQPTYLLLLENLPHWKHLQHQARPLVVRDFSGELFRTMTIPPDQMRFLRDAPTLMMMFNLADLGSNHATRDRFVLDELVQAYISTMEEQQGFDLKKTRRNLIIVLTQSDRLLQRNLLPTHLERYLEDDPIARTLEAGIADPWTDERMADYLQAMDQTSIEIGAWLAQHYPSAATLVNRCKLRNIGLRFCITSATGRPLETHTNKLHARPTPKRILDPLFCALQFEAEGHATWIPPVVSAPPFPKRPLLATAGVCCLIAIAVSFGLFNRTPPNSTLVAKTNSLPPVVAELKKKDEANPIRFAHGYVEKKTESKDKDSKDSRTVYYPPLKDETIQSDDSKKDSGKTDSSLPYQLTIQGVRFFNDKKYAEARPLFQQAAERGHPLAQVFMGFLAMEGWGTSKDPSQALAWFHKADSQNEPQAAYYLGSLHEKGLAGPVDHAVVRKWYQKAAEQNSVYAQFALGESYYRGLGLDRPDYAQAFTWFQSASRLGSAKAYVRLGNIHESGVSGGIDYAEAMKAYRAAADLRDHEGFYHLGYMHEEGRNVGKDHAENVNAFHKKELNAANNHANYVEAMSFYRQSAEQKNADAQCSIGRLYSYGRGVKADHQLALEWFQESALQNNAMGQKWMQWYVEKAKEGDVEAKKALKNLKKGNKEKQQDVDRNQSFDQGIQLFNGEKYAEAYLPLHQAAKHGHPKAAYHLGRMHEKGLAVPIDHAAARKWYQQAAEQEDSDAQCGLGRLHFGESGENNHRLAFEWFQKAALQKNSSGEMWVGHCYQNGIGVEKNLSRAIELYEKAARQGQTNAVEALRRLGR